MWFRSIIAVTSVLVAPVASATSFTCWDGSSANDLAYCPPEPSVIACYFGPPDRYVSVVGFLDEPVLVTYGADNMMVSITFSDTNPDGTDNKMYLTHSAYAGQTPDFKEEIWLEQSSEPEVKFKTVLNGSGAYEVSNSDGLRMDRLECLINSVKDAALSNEEPFQAVILNCGNQ